MTPDRETLESLKITYRRELEERILPFWLAHGRDEECGGYTTCLDRDGEVYDYDKVCMWSQGRIMWTFAYLYNELDSNAEWLDMAKHGLEFVRRFGFAHDGTMYYGLSREGIPRQPAQDVFTELSTVLGFTELARAAGDAELHGEARRIFDGVWERLRSSGMAMQPVIAEHLPTRLHGHSMITLNVLQELSRFDARREDRERIDICIDIMLQHHLDRERRALFEVVGWNGEKVPGYLGRWINPGHMIEGGIFLIHEGQHRNDRTLVSTGVDLIDWGFQWGWDTEFGGIYNDVDGEGKPVPATGVALVYQSKLWWQHAEALYGLLLAWSITKRDKFFDAFTKTHDYSFGRFADPEHGEWVGILDRRGHPLNYAKGSDRKNPFHIGRNLFHAARLLEQLTG